MLNFLQTGDRLDLVDGGETVIKGISAVVNLDDGSSHTLHLSQVIAGEESGLPVTDCEFRNEAEGLLVKLHLSIEEGCAAISLSASIDNPLFDHLRFFDSNKGIVLTMESFPGMTGLLGHYRFNDWWTRPYTGTLDGLPSRTQQLLIERETGSFFQIIPLCEENGKADLQGTTAGNLQLVVFNNTGGFSRMNTSVAMLGIHENPFELAEHTLTSARRKLGVANKDERQYPDIFEYIGWCTWDAFYQQVSEEGIVQKCNEFKNMNLPVRWVIIDDGWQDIKDGKLVSFKADAGKFPGGLASVVDKLKELDINSVGVWHTFVGYWGGIHPESELAANMKEHLMPTNGGALIPACDDHGFGFWKEFHQQLRLQGIRLIKVDGQSAIANLTKHHLPAGKAAKGGHVALEASAAMHFHYQMINCMGMASENLWSRPMSAISRNSDDFVPQNPDCFAEHAMQNVYNSFYHGHLYWGDWDMFWTVHADAERHALLRAVSGGPVYFSDPLQATDPNLIRPLIERDGKLLRCDLPGMPTLDCLTVDPVHENAALKIWSRAGDAGIVAAFHINKDGQPIQSRIRPADIPGLHGSRFAVYEYFSEACSVIGRDEEYPIVLNEKEAKLFILVSCDSGIAPIGLTNKMISPKTIKHIIRNESRTTLFLDEGGAFTFFADKRPDFVEVNGVTRELRSHSDNSQLYTVDCQDLHGPVCVQIVMQE